LVKAGPQGKFPCTQHRVIFRIIPGAAGKNCAAGPAALKRKRNFAGWTQQKPKGAIGPGPHLVPPYRVRRGLVAGKFRYSLVRPTPQVGPLRTHAKKPAH